MRIEQVPESSLLLPQPKGQGLPRIQSVIILDSQSACKQVPTVDCASPLNCDGGFSSFVFTISNPMKPTAILTLVLILAA